MKTLRVLGALLLGMALSVSAHSAEDDAPPCWPAQIGGSGSLAYHDMNWDGFAVVYYCKRADGTWGRVSFYGAWDEVGGTDAYNIAKSWQSKSDAEKAAAWKAAADGAAAAAASHAAIYASSIVPMWSALLNKHDPDYLTYKVTNTSAYYVIQNADKFIPIRIGTVPLNTICDKTQSVDGFYGVPISQVTLAGNTKAVAAVAQCKPLP